MNISSVSLNWLIWTFRLPYSPHVFCVFIIFLSLRTSLITGLDPLLSRKTVQHGEATQWEVWCQIHEKLRFVADQIRPSPGNLFRPHTNNNSLMDMAFPLVGLNLISPFSCWPVFLDRRSKLSRRLHGSLFHVWSFISHYPCFAVSPFSCSVLIDLSVDLWACLLSRLRFHANSFSSDRGYI
jgi:hypothetical protein